MIEDYFGSGFDALANQYVVTWSVMFCCQSRSVGVSRGCVCCGLTSRSTVDSRALEVAAWRPMFVQCSCVRLSAICIPVTDMFVCEGRACATVV